MTTQPIDYWPTEPGRLDITRESDRVTRYTIGGWSGHVTSEYYPDSAAYCITTHNAYGQILHTTRIAAHPTVADAITQAMTRDAAKKAGIEATP